MHGLHSEQDLRRPRYRQVPILSDVTWPKRKTGRGGGGDVALSLRGQNEAIC